MQSFRYEQAVELIDQSGLKEIAPHLKQVLKNTIHLETRPAQERSLLVGTSRLGGWPDLPAAFSWPSWKQVPMAFLAQINLAEVAPYDLEQVLPKQGWLYFFCQTQEFLPSWEAAWELLDYHDPDSWRVLFFDGNALDLYPHPPPDTFPERVKLAPCSVRFRPAWSLPPMESLLMEPLDLPLEERNHYVHFRHTFEKDVLLHGDVNAPHHQLLGYPLQLQGDQQLLCHLASTQMLDAWDQLDEAAQAPIKANALEWVLLLQMDTDDTVGVTWGEAGTLSFWIKRKDLIARNFVQCWAIDDSL